MMKVVSATALLAAAGAANAAFFEVRSVDAGSLGSPIAASSALFNSTAPGNGNFGPSADAIELSPAQQNLAFDSYVGIDVGPSFGGAPDVKGDGFQANPGDISSIGLAVGPGSVSGVWFMDPAGARPEVGSVSNSLFGGADALFLGRFTFRTTTGATPSGTLSLGANGVVVDIRDPGTAGVGSPATDSLLVRFTAFGVTADTGLDGGSLTTHPTAYGYQLVEVVTQANNPSGNARWEIHDLYVVQIPTPGALALFGAAGLAAARRRRA